MRINRTEFRTWVDACCAYRDHQLYFSETQDAFLESMIMGIGRLLDRTKGVLSMEKWLQKGLRTTTKQIDVVKLQEANKMYQELVGSDTAKIVLEIRHNYYAHAQPKWNADAALNRVTWSQLFEMIKKLQEIYNLAAAAGLGNQSPFGENTIQIQGGFPPSNIEEDMQAMLLSIEKECHTEDKHNRQIERARLHREDEG